MSPDRTGRDGGRSAGDAGRGRPPGRQAGRRRDARDGAARRNDAPRPRRPGRPDPARAVAYEVLREVRESDAYANLVLPVLLRERGLTGRDAAFATELAYGTLRLRGRYDAVLEHCTNGRPLAALDAPVLDLLRLGAHQILGMRVPVHAAVSETVTLTRATVGPAPAGLVNAVLRAVARRGLEDWLGVLAAPVGRAERTDHTDRMDGAGGRDATEDARHGDDLAVLSRTESHPEWITRALRQALVAHGRPAADLPGLLAADNTAPRVALVARPGLVTTDALADEAVRAGESGVRRGRWSPVALVPGGGDPALLPSVRRAAAGVQDEGSQLVALALAAAPLGPDREGAAPDRRWLDLCAGPGGKAALLGALAHQRGAHLLANEVAPHRAGLVRGSVAAVPSGTVQVRVGDGRELGELSPASYDRVMVDAPCTGLGALRRRPESRWRRTPGDLTALSPLQRDLLTSALDSVRPGGVVAYVTCSPHLAETRTVVEDVLRRRDDVEVLDAVAVLGDVTLEPLPGLTGPYAQLWPDLHGTDAMFLALLRRR